MKLRNTLISLGMAGVFAGALQAQEASTRFDVGVGIPIAMDGLKSITQKSGFAGFNLDFGYNGNLAATDVPFRASLGVKYLPGSEKDGVKVSLLGYQLAGDLFIKTGLNNLRLVSGLSINKWRSKLEAGGISETESVEGIKFGGRIGLDYVINAHFSTNLTLEVVELGTFGPNGANPSWFQLGARYRF